MIRTALITLVKPSLRTSTRTITTSAARMGEGDTGAPRSGGTSQGDAFTKREQAQEDYAIRQREIEKIKALKEKIKQQSSALDKLDDELASELKKQESK